MKKFVIIVAGGSGLRMGTELPKQFLELCGKPILMHTLQLFYDFDPQSRLILVLPEAQQELWAALCLKHSFNLHHSVASGGPTRFHSVQNGLQLVDDKGLVLIHDGVRPLVSIDTLDRCCQMAETLGNAIPVLPVTESLRKLEGTQNLAVDRSLYFSVQTPQTFQSAQIMESYEQSYEPTFTDDASVAERAGFKIHMVEGNTQNIKITTPTDLMIAEAFIKGKA
ncbi:MAG: 2-C-methyl-D-erythritol 4-phosphate cytidylyltransferase [Verrucomicrobia bacterium]|nr:2-C-methyl-D-erythritol 4-phosphate cytidylyltransferase [Prolixibacteraceae bacterium]